LNVSLSILSLEPPNSPLNSHLNDVSNLILKFVKLFHLIYNETLPILREKNKEIFEILPPLSSNHWPPLERKDEISFFFMFLVSRQKNKEIFEISPSLSLVAIDHHWRERMKFSFLFMFLVSREK
jgi:hypothetical protein